MLTNFIVLILALFVFTAMETGGEPAYSWKINVLGFGAYYILFAVIVARQLKLKFKDSDEPAYIKRSGFLRSIARHSLLALFFYAALLYTLDIKTYLGFLPGETLKTVLGITPFFLFLIVLWAVAFPYCKVTRSAPTSREEYVTSQVRFNLPVIIPLLVANICADLFSFFPADVVQIVTENRWLPLFLIPLFLFLLGIFLPVMVQFIWGCKPITDKEFLSFVDSVCQDAKVKVGKVTTWPIMESHAITAGLMGIVMPFRYILLTPTIIKMLSREELKSVLAHELGHAKHNHLLFNLVLFVGFALFTTLYPDLFFRALYLSGGLSIFPEYLTDEHGLIMISLFWIPIIFSFIFYFRYVFGFFSRNFERQADQFSLGIVGSPEPLVRALEKVASINGIDMHAPNWHHFGINERIETLEESARNPELITIHNRKVLKIKKLFGGFIALLMALLFLSNIYPPDNAVKLHFIEGRVLQLLKEDQFDPELYSLMASVKMEKEEFEEAIIAYDKVLELLPDNVSALNNLAWLLVTSEQGNLRNYKRGLRLAEKALSLKKQPHIMDTLAEAYFVNGQAQKAIEIEEEALQLETGEKSHYREQLKKYKESLASKPRYR